MESNESPLVAREKVVAGQKIWATVVIDSNALNKPKGTLSKTMRKLVPASKWGCKVKNILNTKQPRIFDNQPVLKQAYVLENKGDHLVLAYTTTFGSSDELKKSVKNPKAWYPIKPATNEGFVPLPTPKGDAKPVACWVYLAQVIHVKDASVGLPLI